ncbi:MAG: ABC transporter ATP-binding protein [Myxococcales bacterium]|jgi:ABC-2 type transport system ATP-binding protein
MSEAIVARNLGRRFGERTAVEGLSFSVGKGEVFGLLGPNGAGKTTTVRMLCALLAPSEGEAEICGLRLGADDLGVRASVGLLTEQPGLYDRLSALENLLYFARLYGVEEATARERIGKVLETFGLSGREHERVGGFSKGMRQKLAIARTLIHEPKVVFLDEPTSGLDPEASATVRALVERLAGEGRTIVLCTHNLDEAERLCDRVAIVKGRILAMGEISSLLSGTSHVAIELAEEAAGLAERLRGAPGIEAVEAEAGTLRVRIAASDGVPELVGRIVALGGRIQAVRPAARELERAYLELVGGGAGQSTSEI